MLTLPTDATVPARLTTEAYIHRAEVHGVCPHVTPRHGSLTIETATARVTRSTRLSQTRVLELWCPFHSRAATPNVTGGFDPVPQCAIADTGTDELVVAAL